MDKQCQLKLNGNRTVIGVLRGFDPFMNLVIDEAYETVKTGEKRPIGMVVARGNSVSMIEALERLG
jgi:small nuclear ribonucleoprotein G